MARVDPYQSFRFRLEIDGIIQGGFTECSGFGSSVDPVEYREGGDPATVRKLPGQAKYSDITLKWGITDSRELYNWHATALAGNPQRKNGSIVLFDHAGNVQLFKETNARLVCSAKEKEWAFGFDGPFNGAHLKADYQGLDFETVDGDAEFLPGVSFIQTPGHTPGSMSMRVDLPETGTMIFTADAVYMGASYGPPAVPAAIVNNLEQFYSSVEKLRGIATEANATVVFGHDPDQIKELRTAPEGSYR